MRYLSIAIGITLGWFGGQLLLFVHDRLVLKGPERGFPTFAPLIDYFVITITSVILGGIMGWVGYRRLFTPSKETHKPALPLPTLFRFPSMVSITMTSLMLILAIDALGLPLWTRFFHMRASQAWQAAQLENNKLIVDLLTHWTERSVNDAEGKYKRIQLLSASVISQSDWSESTVTWSDEDWEGFARLSGKSPSRFVAYYDHLWQKLRTLPQSSQLRETLLDACFEIAVAQNQVSEFWERIGGLEEPVKASLPIFLSQLKKEQTLTNIQNPWWLICELGLDRLESLEAFKQELLPELTVTLSNIDRSSSIQSDEGVRQIERLRSILKRWQAPEVL